MVQNANANEPEVVDAPISGAKEADFVGKTEPPIVLRAEESVGEAPSESPAGELGICIFFAFVSWCS